MKRLRIPKLRFWQLLTLSIVAVSLFYLNLRPYSIVEENAHILALGYGWPEPGLTAMLGFGVYFNIENALQDFSISLYILWTIAVIFEWFIHRRRQSWQAVARSI